MKNIKEVAETAEINETQVRENAIAKLTHGQGLVLNVMSQLADTDLTKIVEVSLELYKAIGEMLAFGRRHNITVLVDNEKHSCTVVPFIEETESECFTRLTNYVVPIN